jgi:hypothetical protein
MVYYPIAGYLNGITAKANAFCSLQGGNEAELDKRYAELIASFNLAHQQTEALLIKLGGGPIVSSTVVDEINQFYQFYPAINGILNEIIIDRDQVEAAGKNDPALCGILKGITKGEDSLTASLLKRLVRSTDYEQIVNALNASIAKFNVLGESSYGEPPITSDNPNDLSILQLQTKWWELENLLRQLQQDYQETQQNSLLDFPTVLAYQQFIELLKLCADQLIMPIAKFTELNKEYNSAESQPITNVALRKYREAYQESWSAANLLDRKLIPLLLRESMQNILEEQNK